MRPAESRRQGRRGVVALSPVEAAVSEPIVPERMGTIDHPPGPPLPGRNADASDAAEEADAPVQTPDRALGIGSHAKIAG